MGNSSSTTCCCCNGKISRCCRKDPLADTTGAIYRKRDTDIQEDVTFTNVAFDEETTQTSSIVCIDNKTQTEVITDREPGQATGHQTEADRENNHQDPHATYVKNAGTVIINHGPFHFSDENAVATTFTWPSGWRVARSEQSQREAATMEALQEMRSHLTEMTEELRRSRNEAFTSRSRPNHASVDPEEARTHLDDRFSNLVSQMKGLTTEVSTLQTQLHEQRQRLEEEKEQVMTFALALESRVANFASNLQREQLTEFAENLYRDFNVRLLGFDCGLTFLMEAGINQWSDLIGRQVELEERIRNTIIPEEQRCNTIFRPLVQVPGDIDLRAGEPLPPAVVFATQAPVQVELEHPPREVMVREQQGDIAFKPTEQKPGDIDVRVDEALPDAVGFEIQAPVQVELEHPPREVMVREQQGDIAFKPTEQKPGDIDVRVDEALPDAVGFEIQAPVQVELEHPPREVMVREQQGDIAFKPTEQKPGDIDVRVDEALPDAVGFEIQAPVQVELEHPPREVMVREQQGDIAFKPTEQKPGDIDVRVDEALPDAVGFEIQQEQPGDNQQKLHEDKHSASDLTDESDIPSSSDETDKGERHSGIPHIRSKLHLDIEQRPDQTDHNGEDEADKNQELFETTGLSSPSQTSWYTSVILDSASSRVFKADCSNSIISVATISMLKETSERERHVDVRPWALALLKDGEILASTSENEKQILLIDASNLSVIKTIHTSRLYRGVGEYASERLVVSCCEDKDGEASVDVITWEGEVERTLATSQKLTRLSQPHYLFVHNDHVFISDFSSDYVYRVDRNTGEMIDTMTDPQLQSPCQVSIDPAGKLYVASWKNRQVLKRNTADGMPKPLLVWDRDAESGYEHCRCVSVTDTNLLVSWDRSRGFPMNSVLKAYHTQRLGNKVTWIPDYPFNIIHSKKPHV